MYIGRRIDKLINIVCGMESILSIKMGEVWGGLVDIFLK